MGVKIKDMETETVYSITEAFSMQPCTYFIDKIYNGMKVAKIDIEIINYPVCGDQYDYRYYVGRTEDGKKVFQFRAETVNVVFKKATE